MSKLQQGVPFEKRKVKKKIHIPGFTGLRVCAAEVFAWATDRFDNQLPLGLMWHVSIKFSPVLATKKEKKFKNTDLRFELPNIVMSYTVWCAVQNVKSLTRSKTRVRVQPIRTNYMFASPVVISSDSRSKAEILSNWRDIFLWFLCIGRASILCTKMHQNNRINGPTTTH